MMNRRHFLLGTSATGAAAFLPVLPEEADAAAWVYLGRRRVNGLIDADNIHVGAAKGPFRRIRLRVTGNVLWLYDLDVFFRNGGHQDVPVRLRIRQGGYTRSIDLKGGLRAIRNVRFKYGKFPNGRGATYVELWGRR